MSARREWTCFTLALGLLLAALLGPSLVGSRILSPADVLQASCSFSTDPTSVFEPRNRLLMDPVLQFQPWLEFNRAMLRAGRLPLWNRHAGCGAPHLANAQSAVFDPFHLIAYLGPLPRSIAWLALARLMFAGVGMWFLARAWGLGPWGRWFAGLTFPLTGFLWLWLLFPVNNSAVWMPWCFWATLRVLSQPTTRRAGLVAVTVAGTILGGHIQTSAHVLLAVGLYALWHTWVESRSGYRIPAALWTWAGGVLLGFSTAAVGVIPLGVYLSRSTVWADRKDENPRSLVFSRPRLLDSLCTVVPYVYGSQQRGHPNLAKALGVHNINESAGGYAGLVTLVALAPAGVLLRASDRRVRFLVGLWLVGWLGAFGFPPVANLLRALPVLDVIDQRRLTLWVAFASCLLGAHGLDQLGSLRPRLGDWPIRWWLSLWLAAALGFLILAGSLPWAEPWLEARASRHYLGAATTTEGADPTLYQRRATAQVRAALAFLPWTWGLAGAEILGLGMILSLHRRAIRDLATTRGLLLGLTIGELLLNAQGANPQTRPDEQRPETALVARVRALAGESGRVLGLGAEWPPNVAMRYGLSDPRNYDSVELRRSVAWLGPLFEPSRRAVSSRGTITWAGVERASEVLRESGVRAIVSASPPPGALAAGAEPIGGAWLTPYPGRPFATMASSGVAVTTANRSGEIHALVTTPCDDTLVIRETFDPGWRGETDGRACPINAYKNVFMSVHLPAGVHRVVLRYDPPEVRFAVRVSAAGLAATLLALTGGRRPRSIRFRSQGLGPSKAPWVESNP